MSGRDALGHVDDTITAIATAPGAGGIGIVRMSGPAALAIADRIFVVRKSPASGSVPCCPSGFKSHTVHYGYVVRRFREDAEARSAPDVVDEVLLTVMRAPASYTREDVVEISCHGGNAAVRAVLVLTMEHGARLAEPGEFTRRAFLNGRIDLTQAEAVLDIIQARTETFLRVSTRQLKGDLRQALERMREELLAVYTALEAVVNFPEEGIDDRAVLALQIGPGLAAVQRQVVDLVASGDQGRVLKEGIKIVLCGKPNVGKSSLLNALLRQPRAIVSAIAGTTRDTIEETAHVRGVPLQLVDTAGILEPRDVIEQEAVERSCRHIQSADLIALVLDATTPFTPEDEQALALTRGLPVIVLVNKCDLIDGKVDSLESFPPGAREEIRRHPVIAVSAVTRQGMAELETAMLDRVLHGAVIDGNSLLISNLRHIEALRDCSGALQRAGEAVQEGLPPEFISEEIQSAVHHLDRITGRELDADLLDHIFARFCIGK